jgi:hypothetical protein
MLLLSGNLKRFGLTAHFSENLLHRSLLIVCADPLVSGFFAIEQLHAFQAAAELVNT